MLETSATACLGDFITPKSAAKSMITISLHHKQSQPLAPEKPTLWCRGGSMIHFTPFVLSVLIQIFKIKSKGEPCFATDHLEKGQQKTASFPATSTARYSDRRAGCLGPPQTRLFVFTLWFTHWYSDSIPLPSGFLLPPMAPGLLFPFLTAIKRVADARASSLSLCLMLIFGSQTELRRLSSQSDDLTRLIISTMSQTGCSDNTVVPENISENAIFAGCLNLFRSLI